MFENCFHELDVPDDPVPFGYFQVIAGQYGNLKTLKNTRELTTRVGGGAVGLYSKS